MKLKKIFKSPRATSTITIILLLSSFISAIIHNYLSAVPVFVAAQRFFFFLAVLFLFLFLASFVIFLIAIFHIADIYEIFQNPKKISIISAILLLCSYLSTVINNYTTKIYGGLDLTTKIFFYLALVFLVFFIITFVAMLISFPNKFLYSKKL